MHRLGVLVLPVLLTACGPGLTTTARPHTGAEGQSTSPSPTASPAARLACGTPDKNLLTRVAAATNTHPEPLVSATVVPAAVTPTGTWSVVGVELRDRYDDGRDAGSSSRHFVLVNAQDSDQQKTIPIASTSSAKNPQVLHEDWSPVSWTGETLTAGKRALAFAADCLDDARAGEVSEP